MIETDYILDQIRRFMERLAAIRKSVQEGARSKAADDLTDLERDVEDLWERSAPERRGALVPVKAQINGEMGMLLARLGSSTEGLERLETAREQLYALVMQPEADGRLVELYASILLNAGASHAAARDLDTARARLDEALERLEARPKGPEAGVALVSLRVAALQNRAMVAQQREDWEACATDLERSAALAEEAVQAGAPELGAMAADLRHRLAMVHLQVERWDAAVSEATSALALADRLVGEDWGPGAALWVRAKMILAEVCFAAARFEQGENELFEAIESVPELIEPVLAGLEHYFRLWQRRDDELDAGGLPRDEVSDGLAELLAQLDARVQGDDPLSDRLRDLVRARYDLLVNDDRAAADRLVEQDLPEGADARLVTLRNRLRDAL